MLADWTCATLSQPVVKPLVVRVIKALLLEVPFQIPIHLGHEAEFGRLLAHAHCRLRPERLRLDAPGSLEHLRKDQHGHVATYAFTLPRDSQQFASHCL